MGDALPKTLSADDRTTPGAAVPQASVVIERTSLLEALREVWSSRETVRDLVAQVFTLKMPGYILGVWWIPITIVVNSVAMAFIFGTILTVSSGSGVPYLLFVSVGLMSWWVFNRGSIFSMRSFHRFRHYVTTLGFPLVIVPFVGAAQVSIEIMFNAIFVAGAFVVFWAVDGTLYLNVAPELLVAPLALLWMGLLAAVVGLVTGPVYWRARDVRYVYRLALPFLMFVTPIIYPVSRLDGALRTAAEANPLLAPVELFKASTLGTPGPPWHSVVIGIGTLVVLLVGGLWFTNRFAYTFLRLDDDDLDDDA